MSKNLKKQYSDSHFLFYLPLILVFGIVPLIVKTSVRENPLLGLDWYHQSEVIIDFFLYWKGVILIIAALLMLGLLIYYANIRGFDVNKRELIFIPMILLTFFEIVSSMLTVNSDLTLHGMPDQFETIWVIVAYTVCMIFTYVCMMNNSIKLETISNIMLLGTLPIVLICIGQFIKIDIFRFIYSGEGYTFTFEPGIVYGTFYNINYVGSYVVLLIPCYLAIVMSKQKIWIRVLALVESILMMICLYGAVSTTGVVALVFAIGVFLLIMIMRKAVSVRLREVVFWIVAALVLIAVFFVGKGRIHNYLASCDIEKQDFDYVITGEKTIEFGFRGQTYYITASYIDNEGLYILLVDNDMNNIVLNEKTGENGIYYEPDVPEMQGLQIQYVLVAQNPDLHGVELACDDARMCFSNEVMDGEGYYYFSKTGAWTKLTEENQSKSFEPLKKVSGLANGRGYIWSKTLAVLPQYILFGSGADTFACIYPNDDYVDNMNNGYSGLITTKPHNMYLQYAVQSGVLSLICLLVLFGWYIIKNLKLILTTPIKSFDEKMNLGLFLGLAAYMVTGLANDSTVTVAPVFWTLFGLGIALMNIISHRYAKEEK